MENESTIADDATVSTATTGDEAPATTIATTAATSTPSEVADEQLIEEISIDGMCGVY